LDGQLALTINDDSLSAADIAFGYKCSHRVGRQIGRARCQQLVQLQGLGRVLLGRRAGPIDDRPVVVHEPLARLARLLFVEQRAGKLLHPASLLRGRFGRQSAERLCDEPLALGLSQRLALRLEARDDPLIGRSTWLEVPAAEGLDPLLPRSAAPGGA
jgi:hypothetical protein